MTGKELIEELSEINSIVDLKWSVMGDYFDPILVKVIGLGSNGNEIELRFPYHHLDANYSERTEFIQSAAVALLINKFLELIGDEKRFTAFDDLVQAVNYTITKLIYNQLRKVDEL